MNITNPDRQLREWSVKRLRRHQRALRGVGELARMSRHGGDAHIRPVTTDRSVLVWQPSNRFLQPTIVQCGRPHLAWRPPGDLPADDTPGEPLPVSHHVVLLPFATKHTLLPTPITGTIRLDGGTISTATDGHGREWIVAHGPLVYVETDDIAPVS